METNPEQKPNINWSAVSDEAFMQAAHTEEADYGETLGFEAEMRRLSEASETGQAEHEARLRLKGMFDFDQ